MKLSMEWLGSMVQPGVNCDEYARAMTMSGSKVEKIELLSRDIKNVVVGRLLSLSSHPDADRLQICDVDAGKRLQIVTGASNIKPGDLVPVALDSAELPGGVIIKTGKLRGIESQGMLCSYKELALTQGDVPGSDEDGILILDDGQPGDDIKMALRLEDTVLDFEITNNRPDCLSVIGLARETCAVFKKPFSFPIATVKGEGDDIASLLSVEVEDPFLCPRYSARMVTDVKIEPSPLWMRRRLRAAGIRPINNIVDITNYVMLEYGQPMHAFDFSCVRGSKIVVRRAKPGETIETLDGQERILDDDMLIIADKDKPIGVAGVMGGEGSGIQNETSVIVFESANFNGSSVRKTALKLAMRTDASSRFEKGLDKLGTIPALQRACELVEMLNAGTVCGGLIDKCSDNLSPRIIEFRPEPINALLGTQIESGEMLDYLSRLGCLYDGSKNVTIPSWRSDLLETEDLAEEIARLYGYDNIDSTLTASKSHGGKTKRQNLLDKLKNLCLSLGFDEMLTYAFIGPADYDKVRLSPGKRPSMTLLNPIGEDTSVMRSSALPSLMSVLERNNSARTPAVRFFEAALTYHPLENSLPEETTVLILGGYGLDFLELKGAVESIFNHLHIAPDFTAFNGNPSYHPGRCAQITVRDIEIGIIGELHPEVCDNYGIPQAYACEIDFEAILPLAEAISIHYRPMPRFPSVSRDLALICEQTVPSGELTHHIRKCGGSLLTACELFDVYTGKPIPDGKKSVAFSLTFQSPDKTLTDKEVQQLMDAILNGVEQKFNAILRF